MIFIRLTQQAPHRRSFTLGFSRAGAWFRTRSHLYAIWFVSHPDDWRLDTVHEAMPVAPVTAPVTASADTSVAFARPARERIWPPTPELAGRAILPLHEGDLDVELPELVSACELCPSLTACGQARTCLARVEL